MKFKFGYEKSFVEFNINEKNFQGEIIPNKIDINLTGKDEIERSLNNPICSSRLKDIVKKNDKIVIITSDITRPMPSKIVLPPVINELKRSGINEEDITIVLALGSHRTHTEDEKKYLVGEEIYEKIKVIDSNSNKCIHLGKCDFGTPVDIFDIVANADKRICLGNIEYHYFAGYSGGAKALMPGVSSRKAIQANHSNMVHPKAKAGNLTTNPVRLDIDQIAQFISIDFIVNVILNSKKEIIRSVAGHYKKAHEEGCKFLDSMYKINIEKKADIVITTPGGFPKDINIYQSQKALDNSKDAVRDGGIIILVASCKEGFGEHTFEEWMTTKNPIDMIEEIKVNFKLGGHKAAAIAMVLQKSRIFLVSDLNHDLVRKINLEPFNSVQEAVDEAINILGSESKILLMPNGGSTLPVV